MTTVVLDRKAACSHPLGEVLDFLSRQNWATNLLDDGGEGEKGCVVLHDEITPGSCPLGVGLVVAGGHLRVHVCEVG